MGASPLRTGARRGLDHARVALEAAGAVVIDEAVTVARAPARFDAQGGLTDEATRREVRALLEALHREVLKRRERRAA